ncbi:MAG: GTPase [Halanaeroarchaeum sp.]
MTTADGAPALVVTRTDPAERPHTNEIRALAETAGYRVVDTVAVTAAFDPEYVVPPERLGAIGDPLVATEATTVVVDDTLTPHQTYHLARRLPGEPNLVGRHRLLLDVLDERADASATQRQVERADLAYEQQRHEARGALARRDEEPPGFMGLGAYDPERADELEDRISRLREDIDAVAREKRRRIERRREAGADLVVLTGYVNAGRSTLLQRLAADLAVGEDDDRHPDIESPVAVEKTPFTTLGTTTRALDIPDRDALLTDTMGIVRDVPDWLLEAFRPTFVPIAGADVAVVAVDATESLAPLGDQLAACERLLSEHGANSTAYALTKVDGVSSERAADMAETLEADSDDPVVPVSVHAGEHIDRLVEEIRAGLPERERHRLELPLSDDAMSLLSRIHDEAYVHGTTYEAERVVVDFEARSDTVAKVRERAQGLQS